MKHYKFLKFLPKSKHYNSYRLENQQNLSTQLLTFTPILLNLWILLTSSEEDHVITCFTHIFISKAIISGFMCLDEVAHTLLTLELNLTHDSL